MRLIAEAASWPHQGPGWDGCWGAGACSSSRCCCSSSPQAWRGRCWSRSAQATGCPWSMWWRWRPCWPGPGCWPAGCGASAGVGRRPHPAARGRLGGRLRHRAGTGLLVASVFVFFWWWAIGAAPL